MDVRYVPERLLTGELHRLELINGSPLCCPHYYSVFQLKPCIFTLVWALHQDWDGMLGIEKCLLLKRRRIWYTPLL
jgi:hypothetical protein